MQYVRLGASGLDVSRLCLGCMTFGDPMSGAHSWTLSEERSRPIIKHAVDKGINFFDTANSYSAGTSETIVGKLNLLYREEEREMIPLCVDQGVGLMPWSPLARGLLTRPYGQKTERARTDAVTQKLYQATETEDAKVIAEVERISVERGVPMAQIALAWVLSKNGVSTPIVGASKIEQLDDAISALNIILSSDEIEQLEKTYVPHAIVGFS